MESTPPVLQYAELAPLREGMRVSTILAIFAVALFVVDVPSSIQNLTMSRSQRFSMTARMMALYGAVLLCGLAFGASAIMLLARKCCGPRLLWGTFAMRFIFVPLVFMLIPDDYRSKLSFGRTAAIICAQLLNVTEMLAVTWLLWRAARHAGRDAIVGAIPWGSRARDLAWVIFIFGGCKVLASLVSFGQPYLATGEIPGFGNLIKIGPEVLLLVSAELLLLKRPWAWWPCLIAVILWGILLLSDVIVRLCSGQVMYALRYMYMFYQKHPLTNFPLALALLFTLFLIHPRIRGSFLKVAE